MPTALKLKKAREALVQEMDQGEVTGVSCDLCEKKGIPCQWGKVSFLFDFFFGFLLMDCEPKTACMQACLGGQQAWAKCQVRGPGPAQWKWQREEESLEEGPSKRG